MRSRSRSASRIGALGQPCLPPRSSAPSNLRSAYESCATELKLLHTQFPTFSAPRTTEHKMADVAIPSAAPGTSSDIGKKMAPAPAGATEHGPHMKQCVEECRWVARLKIEMQPSVGPFKGAQHGYSSAQHGYSSAPHTVLAQTSACDPSTKGLYQSPAANSNCVCVTVFTPCWPC